MKTFFILLIRLYQITFSKFFISTCRFYPTCSEYGIQAIKKHHWLKGLWLTINRIKRCHPFNPGGIDYIK